MASVTSVLVSLVAALARLAPLTAGAQGNQITIALPAEATTMDPGRSTQVLTVNYFDNLYYGTTKRVSFRPRSDFRLIVSEMSLAR